MSSPNSLDVLHENIDAFIEDARQYLHENYGKQGMKTKNYGNGETKLYDAFDEWLEMRAEDDGPRETIEE